MKNNDTEVSKDMTQPQEKPFTWHERDLISTWKDAIKMIQRDGQAVFTELFDYVEPEQGVLNGAIITIKDLFQVQGYKTQAGSVFIEPTLAQEDAETVALLRKAGASLLGHTNMTELAYSGLGLNPHYGTPENPIKAGRITGGSTSGGAASVALGVADAALGTDTGGSLRIPAAFCGLTGFKPSQNTVSRVGCLPLSQSLDSVGPIARSVAECELLWRVLSEQPFELSTVDAKTVDNLTFVVPSNFGLTELDELVAQGFDDAIATLEKAGVKIERRFVEALEEYKALPVWQFSAFESRAFYGQEYDLEKVDMDPRVASRIARAKSLSLEDFQQTQVARQAFIAKMTKKEPNSVFLLPTVAVLAPKLSDFAKDAEYDRLNLLCLRNTSLANVLDGCSISLPFQYHQEPMGLMLTAGNGHDQALLVKAKQLESLLDKASHGLL